MPDKASGVCTSRKNGQSILILFFFLKYFRHQFCCCDRHGVVNTGEIIQR